MDKDEKIPFSIFCDMVFGIHFEDIFCFKYRNILSYSNHCDMFDDIFEICTIVFAKIRVLTIFVYVTIYDNIFRGKGLDISDKQK